VWNCCAMFSTENISVGVISGNINPPGVARDESLVFGNPNFIINQVLKTVWLICFNGFLKVASNTLSSALAFRCGSDGNGPGIYCWELSKGM